MHPERDCLAGQAGGKHGCEIFPTYQPTYYLRVAAVAAPHARQTRLGARSARGGLVDGGTSTRYWRYWRYLSGQTATVKLRVLITGAKRDSAEMFCLCLPLMIPIPGQLALAPNRGFEGREKPAVGMARPRCAYLDDASHPQGLNSPCEIRDVHTSTRGCRQRLSTLAATVLLLLLLRCPGRHGRSQCYSTWRHTIGCPCISYM